MATGTGTFRRASQRSVSEHKLLPILGLLTKGPFKVEALGSIGLPGTVKSGSLWKCCQVPFTCHNRNHVR